MKNLLKFIGVVVGALAAGITIGVVLTNTLQREKYDDDFYIFGPDDDAPTEDDLYGDNDDANEEEDVVSSKTDICKELAELKKKVRSEGVSYIKINVCDKE